MSQSAAIDILVEVLTAVPKYDNPLNPLYEVLGRQQVALSGSTELGTSKGPLTLQAIRQYTQLIHAQADQAQDQALAINAVIRSCKRISPTPLLVLPLGF